MSPRIPGSLTLVLVALLATACVAAQPAPTPEPPTPVPSATATTTSAPTLTPAPVAPTSAPSATVTVQPSATPTPTAPLKAVFIVGPTDDLTESNLVWAEEMAVEAESAGMDVRRVFYPHATWENVLAQVQGASLVAYFGHGYGFPSTTTKLTERSQDGMGLNTFDGSGVTEVTYYGANLIRQNIRLAPHGVVFLMHGCYTSGNGLWGTPIPALDLARERVDNYASGWLAVGAGAVFAFQLSMRLNYPDALINTDSSIDQLFMNPREHSGWSEAYFNSVRTPGAVSHLDPDSEHGYTRSVTGDLSMTTATWRSGAGQIAPAPEPSL